MSDHEDRHDAIWCHSSAACVTPGVSWATDSEFLTGDLQSVGGWRDILMDSEKEFFALMMFDLDHQVDECNHN